MKKCILLLFLSLVFLLSSCGTSAPAPSKAETSAPTTTTPLDDGSWNMQAALVNSSGEILDTLELKLKLRTWEQDGRGYYAAYFHYPETVYYSISGVMPYPKDSASYNCCFGFGSESGIDAETQYKCCFGLDVEMECLIAYFDDGQEVFLIASRTSDPDFSALWKHFETFPDTIPDNFPTINN